jgi:ketol-acid reductoisomerase
MDWMYANCSTTAQRGALDWFRRFRDASKPVFEELYKKVAEGEETRRVLEANSRSDYRQQLERELKEIAESEMWQAGQVVRSLRPERAAKSRG